METVMLFEMAFCALAMAALIPAWIAAEFASPVIVESNVASMMRAACASVPERMQKIPLASMKRLRGVWLMIASVPGARAMSRGFGDAEARPLRRLIVHAG